MTEERPGGTERRGGIAHRMTLGTAAVGVQRAVEALVSLFLVPFTLHRLGVDAYGLWALFYAVITYLNLADLGFAAALNHHFVFALEVGDETQKRDVFSSSLAYMGTVAAVVLILGIGGERIVFGFFHETQQFGSVAVWTWRAILLVLVFGYIGSYARALFYCTHRVAHLAMLNTVVALVNAGVTVFVLTRGWGLLGLAGGAVFVSLLRQSSTLLLGAKGVPGWKVALAGVNRATIRKMWRFGLRVLIARISEVIYFTFDRVLLGRVLGLTSVTFYDLGAKAASSANQVPLIVLPVIEPAAATLYARGERQRFGDLLRQASRYMALLALPLMALLIVAGRPLLLLWLGSPPDPRTVLTLQVVVIAYLGVTLTGPLRVSARGAGFPGWEARSAALQAVLNVALSILFYYRYGFNGVLAGTLAATLIGQTTLITIAFRGLHESFLDFVRRAWLAPVAVALVSGAAADISLRWFASPVGAGSRTEVLIPVVACLVSFAVVFLLAAFATRAVTPSEVNELLHHLSGREVR